MQTKKFLYDQKINLEAIALHIFAILIESKNRTVLDLNTDCYTCNFKDNRFRFK